MRTAWFHSHLLHVNSGGTRFVLDCSAGLRRDHGHEVTLYCDVAAPAALARARDAGVRLVQLDRASTNSPAYWLTLRGRIRRKRAALRGTLADLDCVVNSMFPMNWLVSEFPLRKIQICYEPYAFFYDRGFLQNFKPHHRLFFRAMGRLYAGADKLATKKMDRHLTVNATNVPKLREEYGVTADVVYAGIDTDLYRRAPAPEVQELRRRFPGAPLIFHSTDLTGIKGSYPLLEVVAGLRDSHPGVRLLVTVYVDDPAGVARFRRRRDELGLRDAVELLGCLPTEQLPLYYSAVDFVCQPSVNQPASWPLKEALVCETPIIGGPESEEVREFVNGARIDVRDTPAAIEKLRRLLERRGDLSLRAGAEQLRRDCSRQACVARLDRILRGQE